MVQKNLQTKFNTRQYMLSKDFEIYYYADNSLSEISPHMHDYYEIYFFVEGHMIIEINGNSYILQPGDIVVIPPFTKHSAKIECSLIPYRRFVLWLSLDYLEKMNQVSLDFAYFTTQKEYVFHNDLITFNTMEGKVFRVIEEMQSNRFGKDAQIYLCIRDLVLYINRVIYEKKHRKTFDQGLDFYEGLIVYIENHLNEELSLDQLAKHFFISKYHIAHVFKENMGISIHQYILKKRLNACKESIQSGEKVSEAYSLYGFKDYSTFYKAFKAEYGMTPNEYKKQFVIVPSHIKN